MHANQVLALDQPIEYALHIAMSAEGFANMANLSTLRHQLHRFKPVDVLWIVEHVPNNRGTLPNLKRVPGQNDSLDDASRRIDTKHRPQSHKRG